jgi:hypothetical protein
VVRNHRFHVADIIDRCLAPDQFQGASEGDCREGDDRQIEAPVLLH